MAHRSSRFAVVCLVRMGKALLDEFLARPGMPAFREPRELIGTDLPFKPEVLGQPALPLPADVFTLGVVGLRTARELLGVISLRLAGAQRLGDRKHHSKYGSRSIMASGLT